MAANTKKETKTAKSSKPAAKKPARRAASKESELNKAAAELIRMAEEGGVEQNYFFTTTFARYKMQLGMLDRLKNEIDGGTVLIKKTYVKGNDNLVPNPALTEYNKTSLAANQTVVTLMKIIKTFASGPVLGAKKQEDAEEEIDL